MSRNFPYGVSNKHKFHHTPKSALYSDERLPKFSEQTWRVRDLESTISSPLRKHKKIRRERLKICASFVLLKARPRCEKIPLTTKRIFAAAPTAWDHLVQQKHCAPNSHSFATTPQLAASCWANIFGKLSEHIMMRTLITLSSRFETFECATHWWEIKRGY